MNSEFCLNSIKINIFEERFTENTQQLQFYKCYNKNFKIQDLVDFGIEKLRFSTFFILKFESLKIVAAVFFNEKIINKTMAFALVCRKIRNSLIIIIIQYVFKNVYVIKYIHNRIEHTHFNNYLSYFFKTFNLFVFYIAHSLKSQKSQLISVTCSYQNAFVKKMHCQQVSSR